MRLSIMLAMAITTILTICSFVLLQIAKTPHGEAQDLYSGLKSPFSNQCLVGDIIENAPKCEPRVQMIKLPLPLNPNYIAVIPSHVEAQICSGSCNEGNIHHKCIPRPGAIVNKTVEVKALAILEQNCFFHHF